MKHVASTTPTPAIVRWTQRLERSGALDGPVRVVQPLADALLADRSRAAALRGLWLGHAIHPVMTDLPLGAWTSATVLDLVGGSESRPAARRLLGVGILAAVPTAVTGLAEWGSTETWEKRVGVVHAVSNSGALALYGASWVARRRDRQARGVALALAGGLVASVGAYLGGHLTVARKVSSRHPAYESSAAAF